MRRNPIGRRLHRSYNLKDPTFNLRKIMPSNLDKCRSDKKLTWLSALFLALAVAAPTLLSQESDHINGPDKAHDPTGAWLLKGDAEGSPFILTVFHKGGTLTGDLEGESAFDPGARPPSNVINSPESGVWQKTGWNTFSVTDRARKGGRTAARYRFGKPAGN